MARSSHRARAVTESAKTEPSERLEAIFNNDSLPVLLVIARMKRECDDVGYHVDREAREDDSGERRRERKTVGFLVSTKTAGRGNFAEVRVGGSRRNFGAVAEEEVGDEPAVACTVRDTAVVDQF